jgi:predicted RNase H-like HicB family nuclease
MPVHEEVLSAVRRICRERGGWTFTPLEIVRALPHLKPNSVRTHIVSRCCINAPKHHLHRWEYFRRVGRGTYELLPPMRRGASVRAPAHVSTSANIGMLRVAEAAGSFGRRAAARPRDTVHVVVTRDRSVYVAECLELAVVTQGRTLDEVVSHLREAVGLHLEGEAPAELGIVPRPRISMTYDLPG